MNKKILLSLLVILLFGATNGSAQKVPFGRQPFTQAGFKAHKHPKNLAPQIEGVYIPPGTTMQALERRIKGLILLNPSLRIPQGAAHKIAYDPKRLRKFQQKLNHPIFGNYPLTHKSEPQTLPENQLKPPFAQQTP